ncbi:MFS general substrate transporter [Crassisporium funariophilum]|nr:MFS general substrate transporter [Crassisporium funariophilum]
MESSSQVTVLDAALAKVDPEQERRAVRKLDYTILPVMTMFYLLSFLDRANIGNARIAGLQKDLHMTDRQYQICITALYVPYLLSELPSNLLLRAIGPSILMPSLITIWGIMVTLQGFVTSFQGLATLRAFLGLVEGPMFPGIVLYLSGFYTRDELSLRVALFFSAASLSGAFSGLLAAGIDNMHGLGGRPGWAWIFILEGLFTVVFGIAAFFLVPSTPRESRYLTESEKDLIMQRLERDRPPVASLDKFSFKQVWNSLASPHVIFVFIIFFVTGTNLFGLANFLPSIVSQLGFSPNKTQLLSVGPFAAGFVVTLLVAYLSDRYNSRAIPIMVVSALSAVGYAIYLASHDKMTSYGALFLMVPGVYAGAPISAAWMANNSEPHYRRATSIAMGFVATSAGAILSTWRFPTKEGPRFRKTTIMNLTFALVAIAFCIINSIWLIRSNKRKRSTRAQLLAPYSDEKEGDGGLNAWVELGDRHPDFRYIL